MAKERIEFIDLAKGICILLVVFSHCDLGWSWMGFFTMRMPFMFFLSGLFFKDYGGLGHLAFKKLNRLLVPLFSFYTFGMVLYWTMCLMFPRYAASNPHSFFGDLYSGLYYNFPIWFLPALFWANIICYWVRRIPGPEWSRTLTVLAVSLGGWLLGRIGVRIPFFIDTALGSVIFYYMGLLTTRYSLVAKVNTGRWTIPAGAALMLAAGGLGYLFGHPDWLLSGNEPKGSYFAFLLTAAFVIAGRMMICKGIGRLPIVSHFGRYSIIVLGTHALVLWVLRSLFFNLRVHHGIRLHTEFFYAPITLVCCWGAIWLCRRFIPKLCAQEDLFPLRLRRKPRPETPGLSAG